VILGGLISATVAFAAGRATAPSTQKVHPETEKNLDSAMQGEAFAYAKYMLYAQHARANGHPEIARLFEEAAKTERTDHFRGQAELAGVVGSDADNLRSAIQGEDYEQSTLYPKFARQAEARGDKAAAERFDEIARDERKHRDEFKAALDDLERSGQGPARARRGPAGR
jgi:rubrerythrin